MAPLDIILIYISIWILKRTFEIFSSNIIPTTSVDILFLALDQKCESGWKVGREQAGTLGRLF